MLSTLEQKTEARLKLFQFLVFQAALQTAVKHDQELEVYVEPPLVIIAEKAEKAFYDLKQVN